MDRRRAEDAPREPGAGVPEGGMPGPITEPRRRGGRSEESAREREARGREGEEHREPRHEKAMRQPRPHEGDHHAGEQTAVQERAWIGAESDREHLAIDMVRL